MINKIVAYSVLAIIFVISLQTILSPYAKYKNFFELVNGVPVSNISHDEYEAASWLRDQVDVNKSPNSYIISDHATAHIIRGITGLNTTAGRHPDISAEDWVNIQNSIKSIFSPSINPRINDLIDAIENKTKSTDIYIVLSKRTCWWAVQLNVDSIRFMPLPSSHTWNTTCSSTDNKLQKVFGNDVIFRNDDVAIYVYNPLTVESIHRS